MPRSPPVNKHIQRSTSSRIKAIFHGLLWRKAHGVQPKKTIQPPPAKGKGFLELPGDIRNIIYRYAVVHEHDIDVAAVTRPGGHGSRWRTNLPLTCRQIRREVDSIFFGENVFVFDVGRLNSSIDDHFTVFSKDVAGSAANISGWLSTISAENVAHIRHIRIRLDLSHLHIGVMFVLLDVRLTNQQPGVEIALCKTCRQGRTVIRQYRDQSDMVSHMTSIINSLPQFIIDTPGYDVWRQVVDARVASISRNLSLFAESTTDTMQVFPSKPRTFFSMMVIMSILSAGYVSLTGRLVPGQLDPFETCRRWFVVHNCDLMEYKNHGKRLFKRRRDTTRSFDGADYKEFRALIQHRIEWLRKGGRCAGGRRCSECRKFVRGVPERSKKLKKR